MGDHTPLRRFRLPDDVWKQYAQVVGDRGRSADIVAYIHWRMANPETPLPQKPIRLADLSDKEIAEGLERWIKYRRDEARDAGDSIAYEVYDGVLDEIRDAAGEGLLPWQKEWLEQD